MRQAKEWKLRTFMKNSPVDVPWCECPPCEPGEILDTGKKNENENENEDWNGKGRGKGKGNENVNENENWGDRQIKKKYYV